MGMFADLLTEPKDKPTVSKGGMFADLLTEPKDKPMVSKGGMFADLVTEIAGPGPERPQTNRYAVGGMGGFAPGITKKTAPEEDAGLPEIGKTIRELVAPTTPYTEKEARQAYEQIPAALEQAGMRLVPSWIAGPVSGMKPSQWRAGLEADMQEKVTAGLAPAIAKPLGETTMLAVEWGYIYPKLFKAVGIAGEAIGKIPQVAKGTKALKAMGGIDKVAENYPRLYSVAENAAKLFGKGYAVGATTALPEQLAEQHPAGEVIRHVNKQGLKLGGFAAAFAPLRELDTRIYVKNYRAKRLKYHKSFFKSKLEQIDRQIKQTKSLSYAPEGSAESMARGRRLNSLRHATSSLGEQKIRDLKKIDTEVAAIEAKLRKMKGSKFYKETDEYVEKPDVAARRAIKNLEVGLGKSKPFIEMPTTRRGELIEAITGKSKIPQIPRTQSSAELGLVTGGRKVSIEKPISELKIKKPSVLPGEAPPHQVAPLKLSRQKAGERLGKKVTKAKTGKAEGPLVAQLYTKMEEMLDQAQAETDPAKRNEIINKMDQVDNVIGQLDRKNLETKDLTKLQKMAKRFKIDVPKGAKKGEIIDLLAGKGDLSRIQKTDTGYQIKVPIAETKAGRGWEVNEFDTFAEAVDFLEESVPAEKPPQVPTGKAVTPIIPVGRTPVEPRTAPVAVETPITERVAQPPTAQEQQTGRTETGQPTTAGKSMDDWAKVSDKALDDAYHYGLSEPGTFGFEANKQSAQKALEQIEDGETDIDEIAAAVHEGWAQTARTFEDPVYETRPEKRENRMKLAETEYNDLAEDEKEKDRVVARAILEEYRKAAEGLEKPAAKQLWEMTKEEFGENDISSKNWKPWMGYGDALDKNTTELLGENISPEDNILEKTSLWNSERWKNLVESFTDIDNAQIALVEEPIEDSLNSISVSEYSAKEKKVINESVSKLLFDATEKTIGKSEELSNAEIDELHWLLDGPDILPWIRNVYVLAKKRGLTRWVESITSAGNKADEVSRWHRAVIRQALSEGRPVPREVLEEYKSESWAKKELEKPAATGEGGVVALGVYRKPVVDISLRELSDKKFDIEKEKAEKAVDDLEDQISEDTLTVDAERLLADPKYRQDLAKAQDRLSAIENEATYRNALTADIDDVVDEIVGLRINQHPREKVKAVALIEAVKERGAEKEFQQAIDKRSGISADERSFLQSQFEDIAKVGEEYRSVKWADEALEKQSKIDNRQSSMKAEELATKQPAEAKPITKAEREQLRAMGMTVAEIGKTPVDELRKKLGKETPVEKPAEAKVEKSLEEYNLRDLTLEQQGAAVLEALNKGDAFNLSGKNYKVVTVTPKTIRLKADGKAFTIKRVGKVNYGNNRVNNLFRDIESEITVDLVNENNPLHDFSDVYNLAKKGLEKQKGELPTAEEKRIEKVEKKVEGKPITKPKAKGGAGGASVAAAESAAGGGYGTIASSEKNKFAAVTDRRRFRDAAPVKNGLNVVDELYKVVSPASRAGVAREGARSLRKGLGRLAQESVVAHEALRKAHHAFTFMRRPDVYEFIDKMEKGESQGRLKENQIAKLMRDMLDGRREAVQALGKGHLESFYENYFPHIWKDPSAAKKVINKIFGRRRLEGSKSFLKKRTIMTVREGREAGLELVSENPVDLVLLKVYEMDRYIMAQRIIQDLKSRGLIKFVYSRSKSPDGYVKVNDNAFTVYMPPEITKKEAYDQLLVDQMVDVARSLGIDTQRFVSLGKGRGRWWGYASKAPAEKVRTRYAGPESVLAHEIGHVLGFRYHLYEVLGRRQEGVWKTHKSGKNKGERYFSHAKEAVEHRRTIDKEWRDLADARHGAKSYVRKAAEKEAVLLEALIHAPDEFKRVAPNLYELFRGFLNEHSELRPLLDMKPSLVLGTSDAKIEVPGFTTLGHYYAPEPVGKLLNNYLSPGLRNSENQLIASGYNITRMAANLLNQAQLALSGFHALNVTTDMIASTLGLGVRQLSVKGQRLEGVGNIMLSGTAPISRVWMGVRLRKAYKQQIDSIKNPRLQNMVRAIVLADGRDRMDPFYYNQAIKALKSTASDLMRGSPKQKITGVFKLPFQTFGATLEVLAKPLMEWYVPTGKLGLFSLLAEHEMKRAESGQITDEQLHERLISSWDSVDNRMGQLVYDNLFWNKTFKDVLMMAVRSVGWNLGSWREYGGVPLDILGTKGRIERGDVWLSQKMAYTIGAITLYATLVATIGYLLTGERPKELKDYFFPKTGKKNPDGSDERLSLPTYAKDWFAYATQPFRTVKNKLHPIWGLLDNVVRNKDFFNTQVRDPKDPISLQLLDTLKYIEKESLPLSVKNYVKMSKASPGETQKNVWVSVTGITSAPSYITRSPAQKLMYRYIIENIPDKTKTKEKADLSEYHRSIKNRLRKGDPVNRSEVIEKIGRKSWLQLLKDARKEPFAESFGRLSLEQALNVYAIAGNEEKKMSIRLLKGKYDRATKKTPEIKQLYFELIKGAD